MTTATRRTRAAEIHDRLGHPVVDGDGHIVEIIPLVQEYIRKELGNDTYARYKRDHEIRMATPASVEERKQTRRHQGTWSGIAPAGRVDDLATAMLPQLLAERMDDLGFDYAILYGTYITRFARIHDAEIRQGSCRAVNQYLADVYGEFADKMAPAAIIPMHTPEEAVAELEHVKQLGLKTISFPVGVQRPIPAYRDLFPRVLWWDTYGLDSDYDYDPVWAKCVELGFAATFHGGAGQATVLMASKSVSNAVYNHIGSHAFLQHQLCKSLFLGGVSKRFPNLTFGFLECGAAWACQLLANFEEYWEKRNATVMAQRDLGSLDMNRFRELLGKYGGKLATADLDISWLHDFSFGYPDAPPENRDEFAAIGITDEHEIADLFVPNFYFGCEADDPSAAFCFSPANAFGAELKPVLSSDIGHWDVLDMEEVLPDSYRFVEKGLMTPEQYRRFTFENPALLHLRMNPNFFAGSRIEAQAKQLLETSASR